MCGLQYGVASRLQMGGWPIRGGYVRTLVQLQFRREVKSLKRITQGATCLSLERRT